MWTTQSLRQLMDTLDKHTFKKTKLIRGNQKPHVKEVMIQ